MDHTKRIIIAGAGWYGCHIAIELSKAGQDVLLVEREERIVTRCSGQFGIRLHRGPHYPRSRATRMACQSTFHRFRNTYSDLVYDHEESIYAYGNLDEQGLPSKVSLEDFEDVCYETEDAYRLNDEEISRFGDIAAAFELREPSVAMGAELRNFLETRLCKSNVKIMYETEVRHFKSRSDKIVVTCRMTRHAEHEHVEEADFLINTTGYQSLNTPEEGDLENQPPPIDVVYQPCIGFLYEDLFPLARPVSFIVMDGWYPCLMPLIDKGPENCHQRLFKDYIVTHGSLTILGSFQRLHDGSNILLDLDNSDILERIREAVENEMNRFWPNFRSRFRYKGWKGSVIVKPRSKSEFRSSLVFKNNRVIHIVPGKISNVFNACDEVVEMVAEAGGSAIVTKDGWQYIKNGSVDIATRELNATRDMNFRSTDTLQTYRILLNNEKPI